MATLVCTCKPTFLQPKADRSPFNRRPFLKQPSLQARAIHLRKTRVMASLGELSLRQGIAEFYDESSGVWENVWGDHMHHGFYDPDVQVSIADHRSAQIRMIEEALRFAGVPGEEEEEDGRRKRPKRIVDVGCGIGGSSRYLATKYKTTCQGITLSPVQAQRAQALAVAQGLGEKNPLGYNAGKDDDYGHLRPHNGFLVSKTITCFTRKKDNQNVCFQVADALEQPFPDGQFDLVWSMESGEHMPDKTKFVSELARVAAPGATIIIVTWCHRDLSPSEDSLKPEEKKLLNRICDAYYLPAWCSAADYVRIAQSLSLEDIKTTDWSDNIAPFWPAVIRSALTWKGLTSLLRSGWKTIRGALAMPLMIEGYKKELIKFAIITCRKPE